MLIFIFTATCYPFIIFNFIFIYKSFSFFTILGCSFLTDRPNDTQAPVYYSVLFTSLIMFFVFLILIFLSFWFWVSSDLFSVYFSGVLVAILVFCSLSHLFFSGQNDKVEKLTSNKRTRDSNDCQGPNYFYYKTSELEFKITSIKILAGLEKNIE